MIVAIVLWDPVPLSVRGSGQLFTTWALWRLVDVIRWMDCALFFVSLARQLFKFGWSKSLPGQESIVAAHRSLPLHVLGTEGKKVSGGWFENLYDEKRGY